MALNIAGYDEDTRWHAEVLLIRMFEHIGTKQKGPFQHGEIDFPLLRATAAMLCDWLCLHTPDDRRVAGGVPDIKALVADRLSINDVDDLKEHIITAQVVISAFHLGRDDLFDEGLRALAEKKEMDQSVFFLLTISLALKCPPRVSPMLSWRPDS